MLTSLLHRNTIDIITIYQCLLANQLFRANAGTAVGFVRHVHQGLHESASDARALIVSGTTLAATRRIAIGVNSVGEIRDYESSIDQDISHGRRSKRFRSVSIQKVCQYEVDTMRRFRTILEQNCRHHESESKRVPRYNTIANDLHSTLKLILITSLHFSSPDLDVYAYAIIRPTKNQFLLMVLAPTVTTASTPILCFYEAPRNALSS